MAEKKEEKQPEKQADERTPARKVRHPEIVAMQDLLDAIQPLLGDGDARARVLFWFCDQVAPPGFHFTRAERSTEPSGN